MKLADHGAFFTITTLGGTEEIVTRPYHEQEIERAWIHGFLFGSMIGVLILILALLGASILL